MPTERFYTDSLFHEGDFLSILDDEAHHMIKVMRCTAGEMIEMINGKGQLAIARIEEIKKNQATLRIINIENKKSDSCIVIAQGIPRLNRLDTIIEKCTELDVDEFWLFPGDLSEKKALSTQQMTRLQSIAIAAMKQCGRLTLPKIILKNSLKEWKKEEMIFPAFYGSVDPSAPSLKNLIKTSTSQLTFIVGPESGFSNKEEACLTSLGAIGVSLHHNVLRTDTAPITALSIIQHLRMN